MSTSAPASSKVVTLRAATSLPPTTTHLRPVTSRNMGRYSITLRRSYYRRAPLNRAANRVWGTLRIMSAKMLRALNQTKGTTLCDRLEIAETRAAQNKGMLGRDGLE